MNLLFISTFFSEDGSLSFMTRDLVRALSENGHRVTVVTSEKGDLEHGAAPKEKGTPDLLRVKTGSTREGHFFRRALVNIRLGRKLLCAVKKRCSDQKYDLVFYEAPPVTAAKLLAALKKQFNAPVYVFVREMFPQSAVDIALFSGNSFIYRYFKKQQSKLYQTADMLGFVSEGSARYACSLFGGLERGKIEIFPYAKALSIKKPDGSFRKKYDIPADSTVFFFGGGMGSRQAVKFLCSALEKLNELEQVRFVFAGSGSKIGYLKDRLKYCKNVIVTQPLTKEETERFAAESDVGVITLDHRFSAPYYQEIFVTYMEQHLPILAATDPNTDFRNLLKDNKCGIWCASNDVFSFCNEIKHLADDAALRRELAGNSGEYAAGHLDISTAVRTLERAARDHHK